MTSYSLSTEQPPTRPVNTTGRRVALFTGAYNHIADGVSLTLNRLVSYLERKDTDVLVFAPTVSNPAVVHAGTLVPIPSVPLPGRGEYRGSLGLTPSTRKKLAAFEPQLLHIATPDLVGYQALRYAERHGISVVASYHTHFSSYLKYYGFGSLERHLWRYLKWFYDRCEHVYVPSKSMADVLRSHGIDRGLRMWTRGVDTSRFNPFRRSYSWRRAQGIGDDEVLVSFIGRLVWEKGLSVFAEVIEGLKHRGVAHRSMIVGDGPALAELSERLPDTIFSGYLQGSELATAYASSDIFLFPSDTETFGNVTLEAMASGIPAVCADATGSRTLVDHGETGLLVRPGDSAGFLNAVEHLIYDEGLRRSMSAAALQRAHQYEWDAVMADLLDYYDEILKPASPLYSNDFEAARRIHHDQGIVSLAVH